MEGNLQGLLLSCKFILSRAVLFICLSSPMNIQNRWLKEEMGLVLSCILQQAERAKRFIFTPVRY